MKIFIPYRLFPIGGPITFISAFQQQLLKLGHQPSLKFSFSFDYLLVIEQCSFIYLAYAKLRGKKIIQRLNGVYYPALPGNSGKLFWFKNLGKQIIHNYIADYVIYQSQFSRQACLAMLGKGPKNYSIVFNGVDLEQIKPRSSTLHKINLITHASFRQLDQIEPITKSLTKLPSNFHLHIYGPHTPNLTIFFDALSKQKNITYHGSTERTKIMLKLPQYDIFLFSSISTCPNSVLEALAAGLPTAAFNRGGLPEIIENGFSGELVNLPIHDIYRTTYKFTPTNINDFAQAIEKISQNLEYYKRGARQTAQKRFNIETITDQYLKIMA